MKLGRLNHIGIATPSIADSIVFYRDVMGATNPANAAPGTIRKELAELDAEKVPRA